MAKVGGKNNRQKETTTLEHVDISEIRRRNLEVLIVEMPNRRAVELAERAGTAEAYLSMLRNRNGAMALRSIGSALARRLEDRCGKPHGWMDRELNGARAGIDSKHSVVHVPLIDWSDAPTWRSAEMAGAKLKKLRMLTSPTVTDAAAAFATTVPDNQMAPEFVRGAVIVVDPSLQPRAGDYVLAQVRPDLPPIVRLIHKNGTRRFLVNSQDGGKSIEIRGAVRIIGVVREQIKVYR